MTARKLPFHTVDVFTETPFCGNPLAIVEEADDLSAHQMQTIAREFNLSETIFVQKPVDDAHAARVRIFFPTGEIPFAGHPTIGCAIHLAQRDMPFDSDWETQLVLEEEAGLVPVQVTSHEGSLTATLTAPVIPHSHEGSAPEQALAAAALDISPDDIGFETHRCGVHAGGPAFLYVPVSSPEVLAKSRPIEPHWSKMLAAANVDSAYVYTRGANGYDIQARMFSPTAGIPEDPATGSATAILANQLLHSGELSGGTNAYLLLQGAEMGRPATLSLAVDVNDGKIVAVRISGSSVSISSGSTVIPAT